MKFRNSYYLVKHYSDYVISIGTFMKNYFGVYYDGEYNLTHDEMNLFFMDNNFGCLKRFVFDFINDEDILNGRVLLVRDDLNKVIPYLNPNRSKNFINSLCSDKEELSRRREAILNKCRYEKDLGEGDYIDHSKFNNVKHRIKTRVVE